MKEDQDPLLMDHEADGIRELNNKLPRWWVWLFNLTIAFAGVYLVYYHVLGSGQIMVHEYDSEMKATAEIKARTLAKFEAEMEGLKPSTDPTVLADGQRVFTMMCAPCHRADAGGMVGPNLTDDYWIHGPAFKDNIRTIYNGVPDKGMVTWKGVLKPSEIHAVGSYIYTLRGTKPPNPKPPENQAPAKTTNDYE